MKRAALQSKLDAGIRHHRQNELEQAEKLYRLGRVAKRRQGVSRKVG
jgi:hypothetical protein